MGFFWNGKYTMASVFTKVGALVAIHAGACRLVFESQKFKKNLAKPFFGSEKTRSNIIAPGIIFNNQCHGNDLFLYELKKIKFIKNNLVLLK